MWSFAELGVNMLTKPTVRLPGGDRGVQVALVMELMRYQARRRGELERDLLCKNEEGGKPLRDIYTLIECCLDLPKGTLWKDNWRDKVQDAICEARAELAEEAREAEAEVREVGGRRATE